MARTIKPLTAKEIQSAKPKAKEYKLFDGGGLYLSVTPKGNKWWRLKYRIGGKEKRISLGVYPTIGLQEARHKREELKRLIAQGIDPVEQRNKEREAQKQKETKKRNTFYRVSRQWLQSYKTEVSENYHIRLERALRNYLDPHLKHKPMDDITRKDVIEILEALKAKGIAETANRTAMLLNKIFKYAVTHEIVPHNIIADIDKSVVLGKRKQRHYPTITNPKEIRALLLAIDEYNGGYSAKMALKLLPYVFVRSFNIRHMRWDEIDFTANEWTIPADKMKTKEPFTLPLSRQAVTILQEARNNALSTVYVFPSPLHKDRPLSDNTLIVALRRMGYTKDELVPHSFRAMFSTIAHEYANRKDGHGYTSEVIEACLAHKEKNKVKEAYNRSNYKEAMRGLMQWWGDYLEGAKNGQLI